MPLRFSRTPRLVKLLLVSVLTLPLVLPVNFVLINPGEGNPLFPKLLNISSTPESPVTTYPVDGQMYLLSIWVTNPETEILGYRVLQCWAEKDCVVVPRSVVYRPETNDQAESAIGNREMEKSQSTALIATKKLLAKYHSDIDLSQMTDQSIKIALKNTGGPSGGLIFSIGLVELLTEVDLLNARHVAGTGTISDRGVVGAIGGINEKIASAHKAGATLFFAPVDNADELANIPDGIKVITVATLAQAISYLERTSK